MRKLPKAPRVKDGFAKKVVHRNQEPSKVKSVMLDLTGDEGESSPRTQPSVLDQEMPKLTTTYQSKSYPSA